MTASESTIEPWQLAHFESAADLWWDTRTVAKWLHKYNDVRVPYIKLNVSEHFGLDADEPDCLRGVSVLDIGCGGGVLCEPLAQLGAEVTGVDPAGTAISVAKRHAAETGVNVDYRCDTIEALARAGEQYDVVLAMEVIEHVAHIDNFLDKCAELVRPGGLLIVSTINRTWKSFAFAIVMGEYVLRLLPRGAHQWRKFVRPHEIETALEKSYFRVEDVSGVTMNLRSGRLQLADDVSVNFLLTARHEGSPVPVTAAPDEQSVGANARVRSI